MKIAVLQLTSALDYKANLEVIRAQLAEAKSKGAEAFFMPEVFYSMSDGVTPTPYLVEEGNEHYKEIQKLSIDFGTPKLADQQQLCRMEKLLTALTISINTEMI